jgi:hypothetical protein
MSCLTPRPDWDRLAAEHSRTQHHHQEYDAGLDISAAAARDEDDSDKQPASTAGRIAALLEARARERAEARAARLLAQQLAAPDPPAAPWALNVSVEAHACFLTEGATLLPPPPAPPREFAAPLGVGGDVPRFLRRPAAAGQVALAPVGREDVEAAVALVWRSAVARAAAHGGRGCDLHAWLHEHLLQLHAGDHATAVEAGYSLYHAAKRLSDARGSPAVFFKVLTGQLAEGVFWEQQRLLRAAASVFQRMQQRGAATGHLYLSTEILAAALRFLLPFKPADQQAALQQHLHLLAPADGRWDARAVVGAARVQLVTSAEELLASGYRELQEAAGGQGEEPASHARSAADALVEELLNQQLKEIEQHTGAALQRLRQLLLRRLGGAPAAEAGAAAEEEGGERLWEEVVQALDEQRGGGPVQADSASAASSLLATAAAMRLRHQGSTASRGDAGHAAAAGLPCWLRAAVFQLAATRRLHGGSAAAAGVEQMLAALRSAALLLPASCRIDVAGALQWGALRDPASAAAAAAVTASR